MKAKNIVLVSTRKGLIEYHKEKNMWGKAKVHFKAIPVTFTFEDTRNGSWWSGLDHGHWGVKLHKSDDKGKTWNEVQAPQYPEGYTVKDQIPAKTEYIWSIAEGGLDYPDRLWMGTIPGGLFKSENGGHSWELIEGLWQHPTRENHWFGAGFDHPGIHSIIVDPNDNNHITVGISVAGVFESYDAGSSWTPINKGLSADFLPDPNVDVGHDPHILVSTKSHPEILWQQNHCGIFRSTNSGKLWTEIGKKGTAAHFGFGLAVDEKNAEVAWVAPAVADEYRVAIDEALCICRTDDGGKTWKELRNGLPQTDCFDIIYRHALAASGDVVVFGTTTGNLFISNDRGESWQILSNYLPLVYAVTFAGK